MSRRLPARSLSNGVPSRPAFPAAWARGPNLVAGDATQQAFLRALEHFAEFRGDAAFGPWLGRIDASLTELDDKHRLVLLLRDGEGYSVKATAAPLVRGGHRRHQDRT